MAQNGGKAKSSRHFIAGLGSGVASAVILQPLDLLKTRVQQSGHRSLSSSLREVAASPSRFRALWRGTVPSALRTGFGSALYFTTLNAVRTRVARSSLLGNVSRSSQITSSSSLPTLSNSANLLAGAGARTFAGLVLMPLTVIKVRYESNLYSYQSIAGASRDIFATGGLRGFFAGFGATAVRDAPYAGMYVLFYEMLKRRFSAAITGAVPQGTPATALTTSQATTVNFSSGCMAAALCSAISNPFDAVKTRIQLQPDKYRNMYQACRKMLAEDGARSLFDGLGLRMSRKALSSALAWTVYEELMRRAERTFSNNANVSRLES